jgi:hypothetical protein
VLSSHEREDSAFAGELHRSLLVTTLHAVDEPAGETVDRVEDLQRADQVQLVHGGTSRKTMRRLEDFGADAVFLGARVMDAQHYASALRARTRARDTARER